MATIPQPLTLTQILDAGVLFMGLMSGGLKTIAPPEMPKIWVILGTITASGAFFAAKALLALNDVPIPRNLWLVGSVVFVGMAIICAVVYVLKLGVRTITYAGETKLAGTADEYRTDVETTGKSRKDLMEDATGKVEDIWTEKGLDKSRRCLGICYTLLIGLLAFGLYLGIEALNAAEPPPTFAEEIADLKDVHFELNKSDLSADASAILNADAEILKDVFKQFNKATVILDGYCDDRGTDEYNFVLGYKRAEAAMQALLAAQIDKERLAVSSHGRKEAVSCQPNDKSCHQKNRRVHLWAIQN